MDPETEDITAQVFPVHCHCPSPAVSKGSFDSLSLQECLEEFLIGLFGLSAQLLLPLPPQSLQESHRQRTERIEICLFRKYLHRMFTWFSSNHHHNLPESASSAEVRPHQTQTLAGCGRRAAYRCGEREWGGGRSGHCCLHGPSRPSRPGSAICWCLEVPG